MPTFFAWVIIIVILLLLLILFRKFLRRVVFVVILLAVAFFMYGLFSPSGASKLWYSVKTFPQWVASFLGGEAYVPYDTADENGASEIASPAVQQGRNDEPQPLSEKRFKKEQLPSKSLLFLEKKLPIKEEIQNTGTVLPPPSSVVAPLEEVEKVGTEVVVSEETTKETEERVEEIENRTGDVIIEIEEEEVALTPQEIRETEELFEMLGVSVK